LEPLRGLALLQSQGLQMLMYSSSIDKNIWQFIEFS
jgi:hypothetical protein